MSGAFEKQAAEVLAKMHIDAEKAEALAAYADLLDKAAARARNAVAKPATDFPGRFGMIGQSPAMEALFDMIERVSASHVPVLVHGETGSGKELVAHALHAGSPRANKIFLAENCAAIAASLLESELFGHVRGAFTDASRDRDGSFVAADGGTVFLDEIGDMPMEMQAKILRVVQEGEVRPVGSNKVRKVDVRLVAASHRDLGAMVKAGEFREDLLYRLNVITLEVPALRDRPGDVELLANFYLGKMSNEDGTALATLTPAARQAMADYAWPGNVRELENEIRRATALLAGTTIDVSDLSPALNK